MTNLFDIIDNIYQFIEKIHIHDWSHWSVGDGCNVDFLQENRICTICGARQVRRCN